MGAAALNVGATPEGEGKEDPEGAVGEGERDAARLHEDEAEAAAEAVDAAEREPPALPDGAAEVVGAARVKVPPHWEADRESEAVTEAAAVKEPREDTVSAARGEAVAYGGEGVMPAAPLEL